MPTKVGNHYVWGIDEKGQPHDEWANVPSDVYIAERSKPEPLNLIDLPENLGTDTGFEEGSK